MPETSVTVQTPKPDTTLLVWTLVMSVMGLLLWGAWTLGWLDLSWLGIGVASSTRGHHRHRKRARGPDAPEDATPQRSVPQLLQPRIVSEHTGRQKLFMTNKGLRTYETDQQGFPVVVSQLVSQ